MTAYGPLAEVAVGATMVIVLGSMALQKHTIWINALLTAVIGFAFLAYAVLVDISIIQLPFFLFDIVFTPGITRRCLLIFWTMNVIASVIFGIIVALRGSSSTIHRKFFHLTVSLIYVTGLFLDRDFLWLCGWLFICIFVIIEVLRFSNVQPWGDFLNSYLTVFKDEQDGALLLTPIFLILGVFLPLFFSPKEQEPLLYQLAGVAAVGVGDSLAAIVGSQIGRRKWPGRSKTIEGSVAMSIGIFLFLVSFRPLVSQPVVSFPWCILVAVTLSFVEAFVKNVDNILLPVIGYLMLIAWFNDCCKVQEDNDVFREAGSRSVVMIGK